MGETCRTWVLTGGGWRSLYPITVMRVQGGELWSLRAPGPGWPVPNVWPGWLVGARVGRVSVTDPCPLLGRLSHRHNDTDFPVFLQPNSLYFLPPVTELGLRDEVVNVH